MRRILLIVSLALMVASAANAQLRDFPVAWNGWEAKSEAKLAGPVQTVLTTEQRGEKVFGTWADTYDPSGRKVTQLYQNAGIEIHSGSMVRLGTKSVYSYGAHGKLDRVADYSLDGLLGRRYTFGYDSGGRLVESAAFEGETISRRTLYVHSPERREIEIKNTFYHDGRAVPAERTVLTYNEKNQWVKRTTYEKDGSVKDIITYEYDAKGNLAKEIHCCKYNYTHRYEYKYDRRGNWIERQDIYSYTDAGGKEIVDPNWMHTYRAITYSDEKGHIDAPK